MTNSKLQEILEQQRVHWNNVVLELLNGRKETHWCWYFLPNIPGLGTSEQSKHFAVTPDEFIEFMENSEYAGNIHTVMHLIDRAHRNHPSLDILYVLGDNEVDVLKLKSFYTLYRQLYYYGLILTPPDDYDITETPRYYYIAEILQCSSEMYGVCEFTQETLNRRFWS